MKLGVTYSIFSGLELLKPSLLNVRPFADHIVGVYSNISHTGQEAPKYLKPLLKELFDNGLIDELIEVNSPILTDPIQMQGHFRLKRETGRMLCKNAGCTHHMIKDCDEFFHPAQFAAAKQLSAEYDSTVAPIAEYCKKPTLRIKTKSALHVPVIQKIDLPLHRCNPFLPISVDVGRTVKGVQRFKIFTEAELVMHHMTLVRINREEEQRKFYGHGHLNRTTTVEKYMARMDSIALDELEEVPDMFQINSYWKEFREQWLK